MCFFKRSLWLLIVLSFFSCEKTLYPTKGHFSYYNISDTLSIDSSLVKLIAPYKDSLEEEMGVVLAENSMEMPKNKPESLLGNFMADLILEKAMQYYKDTVDFSVLNYGGLRIPSLPKGTVTKGKVFELMPFDNFLVIITLKGDIVSRLMDDIAMNDGWPVAGITFRIKDQKAKNILINGQPLDAEKAYSVAISDYLADGGDNLSYLIHENRENLGIFLRDVIIEYFKEHGDQGIPLSSQLDGRIRYE